ncbi:MAG: hypothetical protein CMD35_03805, partial [Flavobacteriales bacterium]|nr:hypothetical protein [Flavobacteriales bacterium]
ALIGLSGTLGAAAVKIRKIIEDHEYEVVHFTVVALFLALTLIPLKYLRKTKPTEVKKSDVKDFRITKKHFVIIMKGWKGFSLVIKHDLKYFTEEGIDELKAYLSS